MRALLEVAGERALVRALHGRDAGASVMAKKYVAFLLTVVLTLVADQASKQWARSALKPLGPRGQTVVDGYFELQYSENPGAAFSMLRDSPALPWVLALAGTGALVLVGAYLRKAAADNIRFGAELGLLMGGALGNIIDRIAFGRVTDFITWHAHEHYWPTFNIADSALVVGVALLFFEKGPVTKRE
jgi:signal peptidase II